MLLAIHGRGRGRGRVSKIGSAGLPGMLKLDTEASLQTKEEDHLQRGGAMLSSPTMCEEKESWMSTAEQYIVGAVGVPEPTVEDGPVGVIVCAARGNCTK
jgi:hypothetical protein